MLKTLVILSGNFTDAGNFSGYDATGTRTHFYGEQIKAVFPTEKDVKFPFYAMAVDKVFDTLDTNGAPIPGEEFTRTTATAVFKDQNAMVEAMIAGRKIDILATSALRDFAATTSLDTATINALVAATI